MTRIDSMRAATGTAKDSVLHAAEVVAPYAGTAKDQAAHYAQEARARLAPMVAQAAQQARASALESYGTHLQPRIEHARDALPPKVDAAAQRAARHTRKAARQATDYARPRVESAVAEALAAAEPMREEALARGGAAFAALRGQVSAKDVERLVRKHNRRAKRGRTAKRLLVVGLVAGGAVAVWKWWDKQANPDWLVEPPAATELGDPGTLGSVDGSGRSDLDPEVQAKQDSESAADERDKRD